MVTNKKKVLSNFFWRFFERCGNQIVGIIVSIILARLLEPSHYGAIALVTVFTSLMQVFVDSGLGSALIQKKDADNLDYSTVFYFNIIFGVIIYSLMFFAAPYISSFYKITELCSIIRILSITIIIGGITNVQHAYIAKNLIFKKFFFTTLTATLTGAIVGIYMAYNDYGVWALVCQNLINHIIATIALWLMIKWRPIHVFSFQRLKSLFSFGWKILVSELLKTLYSDIRIFDYWKTIYKRRISLL